MSRAFDLTHIKAKVYEMDSPSLYYKWLDDHPECSMVGHEFAFLLPSLFDLAAKIDHKVTILDPACKLPSYMSKGRKILGFCQTSVWGQESKIYLHPNLSPDERVRVLTHEITHALGATGGEASTNEITAECTAHLVCREFGFDTWNFTYPYLGYNFWSEGGDFQKSDINKYTNEILSHLPT